MTIIRRPDRAEGGLTPEEKIAMKKHSNLWIKRAFRTDPIEPEKIIPAIEGLYAVSGLKKPRVIIVPSPIVMVAAFGAASAILAQSEKASKTYNVTLNATDNATRNETDDATYNETYNATKNAKYNATYNETLNATLNATRNATSSATLNATKNATYKATRNETRNATLNVTNNATDNATYNATNNASADATDNATADATRKATDNATSSATLNATRNATRDATNSATRYATDDATYNATYNATRSAIYNAINNAISSNDLVKSAFNLVFELSGNLGIQNAKNWNLCYQGGNMWAPQAAYLTAARDILGLKLPSYEKYAYWEQAAIHGGFRIMHEDFCLVCDFPEILKVDERYQPHSEVGPSHRWRDGWSLYHWHGVSIPQHWIEDRANLTALEVLTTTNIEQRAAGIAIIGMAKMLDSLVHTIIDSDEDPLHGDLIKVTIPNIPDPVYYLSAYCPRNGRIMEAVNPKEMNEMTVKGAQAWRLGIPVSEFVYPTVRT